MSMHLPRSLIDYVLTCTAQRCSVSTARLQRSACRQPGARLYASTASKVRVRFAPSPTGSLHLGGLRSALFNYLFARKHGGQFILRIEDTDRTRLVEGSQQELVDCLEWAGLHYDEGPGKGVYEPYVQSERRNLYDKHIKHLIDNDHAYHCFCSAERLDALRMEARRKKSATQYDGLCRNLARSEVQERTARGDPWVVRFKNRGLPPEQVDMVYGTLKLTNSANEDFILVKADGMPTYHFANVVDDHLMQISHVLRGEEWIPSTAKHLALYQAFGWHPPAFAHMPILVNPDGSKLSKRSGDVKVLDYINNGWEPEALINFVALMGASWHGSTAADGTQLGEVLTMQDMIDNFDLSNLNKHRSTMFSGKLAYLNRGHLVRKAQSTEDCKSLVKRAQPILRRMWPQHERLLSDDYVRSVIILVKDRLERLDLLPELARFCFEKPDYDTAEAQSMLAKLTQDHLLQICERLARLLDPAKHDDRHTIDTAMQELKAGLSTEDINVWTPLRYVLTGRKAGPGVIDIMEVLGAREVSARLHEVARRSKKPALESDEVE